MLKLRHLTASAISHKTVLVRVDFNVPLKETEQGWTVKDDRRLQAALPTITFLLEHQARVILVSHLGRPESKKDTKYSLAPIAEYLSKHFKLPVSFCPEVTGPAVHEAVAQLQPASVLLLENVRFYPEEEVNDAHFAKELATLAEVYINEAFSACHRDHASVVGVTKYLPSFAGFALETEVTTLLKLLDEPRRPFVVVLGGAKISDKVAALENLSNKADIVLIGGAAANNFLKAEGFEIYRSFVEEATSAGAARKDFTVVAHDILAEHKTERVLKDGYIPLPKLIYPIDVVAAPQLETTSADKVKEIDLSSGMADKKEHTQLLYLDIGPKTRQLYTEILSEAGTIFWNGPLGVWENPLFAEGTKAIARAIVQSNAHTVIGGGDTIAAAHHFHVEHKFSYVSAAGGAALKLLGGDILPGIKPLITSN